MRTGIVGDADLHASTGTRCEGIAHRGGSRSRQAAIIDGDVQTLAGSSEEVRKHHRYRISRLAPIGQELKLDVLTVHCVKRLTTTRIRFDRAITGSSRTVEGRRR